MLDDRQAADDFKPARVPAWWPLSRMVGWLLGESVTFDSTFLDNAVQELHNHVSLEPNRGAATEGQLFTTAGLNLTYMPRFGPANAPDDEMSKSTEEKFAEITLSARVQTGDETFKHLDWLDAWHPIGGERTACPLAATQSRIMAMPRCLEAAAPIGEGGSNGAGLAGRFRARLAARLAR